MHSEVGGSRHELEQAVRRWTDSVGTQLQVALRLSERIVHASRSATLDEAFEALSPWLQQGLVTRLAEVTGVDRLGIPNFYSVRPGALHPSCVVASGKGTTRDAAIVSALFEAFERWAGEQYPEHVFEASLRHLRRESQLPIACLFDRSDDLRIFWTMGIDLISGRPCFVPLRSVLFPYTSTSDAERAIANTTNGLSAGVTFLEAIVNGVLELIERDAISSINRHSTVRIHEKLLQGSSAALAQKFRDASVRISINLCSSPTGVPVFYCLSKDEALRAQTLFCSGSGASLDSTLALNRALTETSQSRAGYISALRFDASERVEKLHDQSYSVIAEELEDWFDDSALGSTPPVTASQYLELGEVLLDLTSRISNAYQNAIIACVPLVFGKGVCAVRLCCPQMK